MKFLGSLFGPGSIKPLFEHFLKIERGAKLAKEFLSNYIRGSYNDASNIARQIAEVEEEADRIKDETRKHISSSIFAAVKRPDIIQYLSVQDDIADHYTKVVSVLNMRKTLIPKEIEESLFTLYNKSIDVVFVLGNILKLISDTAKENELDSLLALIARAEHEASEKEEGFLMKLFEAEKSLDPVSVVVLMHVSDDILAMAKRARNASDILKRLFS